MDITPREQATRTAPLDAASIILIQDAPTEGLRVLLLRRNKKQSFGANAFVFPGGQLDDADQDPELADLALGLDGDQARARLNEPGLSPRQALGLYFAALRETFEEAGVLLRSDAGNAPPQGTRRKMNAGELTLKDLARNENMTFDLGLLTPYARWITPAIEKKRFDARFFLALLPQGLKPVHDDREMTETLWTTPAQALEQNAAGQIYLMPPTMKILESLAEFPEASAAFAAANRKKILPILPEPVRTETTIYLKLPHDPEYSIEAFKQPPRPGEPSRVILTTTGWQTAAAE
ncbi:MAG: NUDIX hydrolase [Pseudomonadota bacterium]